VELLISKSDELTSHHFLHILLILEEQNQKGAKVHSKWNSSLDHSDELIYHQVLHLLFLHKKNIILILPMRNIKSTIDSTFQCTKNFSTGCCASKTNIKITAKWPFLTFDWFIFKFTTCDISCALIYTIKFMFL
jgi:hypothetical protein